MGQPDQAPPLREAAHHRDGDRRRRAAGRRRKNALPFSSFTWNKTFIESCQADNLKRLDLDRYFGFRSAISKRMYRFLDKRFYVRADWVFDLKEFAFENVGLSRNYAGNAGKIKGEAPARLEELEVKEFLEPLPREERYQKAGRDWTIRLARRRGAAPLDEGPTAVVEDPTTPLVEDLVERGVTRATAAELARQFAAEVVRAKLEIFDWLVGRKDRGVKLNPAGYLVDSIRKDYAAAQGLRVAGRSRATARRRPRGPPEGREGDPAEGRGREADPRRRRIDRGLLAIPLARPARPPRRRGPGRRRPRRPGELPEPPLAGPRLPPEPPPRMDPRHPRRAVTRPAIATPSRRRRPASSAPKNSEMTWRWLIGPSSPPPFQSSFAVRFSPLNSRPTRVRRLPTKTRSFG